MLLALRGSPKGARFSHQHAPKNSQEAGELHLLPRREDRELQLSSCGAGVCGAGVPGAGTSTAWLRQCLELLAREDKAIPVPARCRGQEDAGMGRRCSQGRDGFSQGWVLIHAGMRCVAMAKNIGVSNI